MGYDIAGPLLEELSAEYEQPPTRTRWMRQLPRACPMFEMYPAFTMHYAHGLHVEILEMDDPKNHLDSARKVEKMEEVDHQYHRVTQRQRALV